jgi:hypothetical protein
MKSQLFENMIPVWPTLTLLAMALNASAILYLWRFVKPEPNKSKGSIVNWELFLTMAAILVTAQRLWEFAL